MGRRILGMNEQKAFMRLLWKRFHCRVTAGVLTCRGDLRPLPISREYHVRIDCRAGENPKVWVAGLPAPDEEPPENRIPHRYSDGSVCLFYGREWTPDRSIAQTIVPWLLEWLMYYEGWLATGEWQGGGIHPQQLAG